MVRLGIFLLTFLFLIANASANEWAIAYGYNTSGEIASAIQQTSDGGYIVAGMISYPIWILKLDRDGNIEWQKAYGDGSSIERATDIQQTSDGGYIVAGDKDSVHCAWIVKLNGNGNIEWQKAYCNGITNAANAIQQTNDGGLYCCWVYNFPHFGRF